MDKVFEETSEEEIECISETAADLTGIQEGQGTDSFHEVSEEMTELAVVPDQRQ